MAKTTLSILLVSLLLTGCSNQINSSISSQSKSAVSSAVDAQDSHTNDITGLTACEESMFSNSSVYFNSSFQSIDLSALHDAYFQKNADNSILLEPIRITSYYKIDNDVLQFQDTEYVSEIKDSLQCLEINQSFSQITDPIQLPEGYIAFYFYPSVSKKDYYDSQIIADKVKTGEKTYCDGIYELRWTNEIEEIS